MDLGWSHLTPHDKETILRGIRDGVAYGGPYHVEIHPADRCNIGCFFCSTAAIRGTDELPLPRIEELIGELKPAGTRAIRFSGGGEPLFHRRIKDVLRAIEASGIPIENITTNAVLLDAEIANTLTRCCDQITVSLNTGDAESYARMMQTPARNFDRVLKRVRGVLEARKRTRSSRPLVNLQFLVWRENYRSIPRMYDLARELEVDTILFSGLAFLRPEQQMSDEERREMLALYESVIRVDEFRRIQNVGSFECNIQPQVDAMIRRLSAERESQPLFARLRRLLTRNDYSLREKIEHRLRMRRNARADRAIEGFEEACVIGWYSMLVRSDGTVGPCCILQHKKLGNIFATSLPEVWNGQGYNRFRRELTDIIRLRSQWSPRGDEATVETVCGSRGKDLCPMKSFYFARDVEFVRQLDGEFARIANRDHDNPFAMH